MNIKEMKELARQASMRKYVGEDIDLSLANTVGNEGSTHKQVWEPKPVEEKTKEEIIRERDDAVKKKEQKRRDTSDSENSGK